MCRAVKCRTCGRTTWTGCGQHVQAVKTTVPPSEWCDGSHSRAELDAADANRSGFFSRMLGR